MTSIREGELDASSTWLPSTKMHSSPIKIDSSHNKLPCFLERQQYLRDVLDVSSTCLSSTKMHSSPSSIGSSRESKASRLTLWVPVLGTHPKFVEAWLYSSLPWGLYVSPYYFVRARLYSNLLEVLHVPLECFGEKMAFELAVNEERWLNASMSWPLSQCLPEHVQQID